VAKSLEELEKALNSLRSRVTRLEAERRVSQYLLIAVVADNLPEKTTDSDFEERVSRFVKRAETALADGAYERENEATREAIRRTRILLLNIWADRKWQQDFRMKRAINAPVRTKPQDENPQQQ
jgi:FKBP-type peptidyl-prolyl cis-trans isomerase (trigger factor)